MKEENSIDLFVVIDGYSWKQEESVIVVICSALNSRFHFSGCSHTLAHQFFSLFLRHPLNKWNPIRAAKWYYCFGWCRPLTQPPSNQTLSHSNNASFLFESEKREKKQREANWNHKYTEIYTYSNHTVWAYRILYFHSQWEISFFLAVSITHSE